MNTQHTPEPWVEVLSGVTDSVRQHGSSIPIAYMNGWMGNGKANARRIAACVNACAGIPDEVLMQKDMLGWVDRMRQQGITHMQQRDELLAAAIQVSQTAPFGHEHVAALRKLDEAIAKVRGAL